MIVELLEQEAPHPGSRTAGDGVTQDEALERIGGVRLAVDRVHEIVRQRLALVIPGGPIISSASAVFGQKDALRIKELTKGRGHDGVNHAGFEIHHHGARYVAVVVGLIEKDVFSILGVQLGVRLKDAVRSDAVLVDEPLPEL